MKTKVAKTYISGFCSSPAKGAHDRCGRFPLPDGVTCRCSCHLSQGTEEATGNFPSGEAADGQAEATAAVDSD